MMTLVASIGQSVYAAFKARGVHSMLILGTIVYLQFCIRALQGECLLCS